MKNNKLICIFMMVLIVAQTAYSQGRNVIWVHGFLGDDSSWKHYADIFTAERQINSTRLTYPTINGLAPAANSLNNSVSSTASTNLAIGHSMGGVMIRRVELDNANTNAPQKFGGYITVASPNNGAPAAQSVLDGSVNSAAATAAQRLAMGPASIFLSLGWVIVGVLTRPKVIDYFLSGVDFLKPATNNDLRENSPAITALNNFNSTAHRISIIAQENSPVHWRMVGSMSVGENKLVNIMKDARGVYHGFYLFNKSAGLLTFSFIIPHNPYHLKALSWKQGRDWFDDSETIWNSLIKSSRMEQKSYLICEYVPIICRTCRSLPPFCRFCHSGTQRVCVEYFYYASVNYPSDGLLPTYSQELKGVTAFTGRRYTINYANHIELKNMSNSKLPNGQPNDGTGNTLRTIFDRHNDWFTTQRR